MSETYARAKRNTGTLTSSFRATRLSDNPDPAAEAQNQAETPNSAREYGTVKLKNGLVVSLTYDPSATTSAASLAVGAGSLYEPKDKPGLAHFLEHMLFLGTKKYPVVGEYQQFLEQNNGDFNAYTADDVTNFFFGVGSESFEGALARFSDFFKNPLLDGAYAGKEVNAVNSEFDKDKADDDWRAQYLQSMTANPGHPLARFSIGNRDTLSGDNQDALKAFFHKYYAASNMKLALVSDLPLDEQEKLVKKYFSGIPDFKVRKPTIDPDFRTKLEDKYRLLQIKATGDTQQLTLQFPTIKLNDHLRSKPDQIISAVLGHEGKGSLLSRLKEEGLALGISASGNIDHPAINTMNVSIDLTDKGMKDYGRVMEIAFAYIDMLKKKGVQEYTFQEEKAMSRTRLDWDAPAEETDYVSSLAPLMFSYKPADLATLPYLVDQYDPKAYKAVLDTLTPGNMLATLVGHDVKTDRTDEIFGAEYSFSEIGGDEFRRLAHPPAVDGISYPAPNKFIPHQLHLASETPHPVANDQNAQVWSQFDNAYGTPQAYMSLRLETPKAYDTVNDYARALLWNACLKAGINEDLYPLQQAGMDYESTVTKKGVVLTLGGYTEHINDLAALVAQKLTSCDVDADKFADIRSALIRGVQSDKTQPAGDQVGYYLNLLTQKKIYSDEEIEKALAAVSLDDVRNYARTFLKQAGLKGTAYGNLNDDGVKKILDTVARGIGATSLKPANDTGEPASIRLSKGANDVFSTQVDDNNSALMYVLQSDKTDLKHRAAMELVSKIVESDFYTQMRTKQQLGYVVENLAAADRGNLSLDFFIQSGDYGPVEMQKRVDAWLKTAAGIFDRMTDDDYRDFQAGVAADHDGIASDMMDQEQEIFSLATKENGNFSLHQQLYDAIMGLSRQEVVAFAHELLDSPDTPRLIMQLRSRDDKVPAPANAWTDAQQFRNRAPA